MQKLLRLFVCSRFYLDGTRLDSCRDKSVRFSHYVNLFITFVSLRDPKHRLRSCTQDLPFWICGKYESYHRRKYWLRKLQKSVISSALYEIISFSVGRVLRERSTESTERFPRFWRISLVALLAPIRFTRWSRVLSVVFLDVRVLARGRYHDKHDYNHFDLMIIELVRRISRNEWLRNMGHERSEVTRASSIYINISKGQITCYINSLDKSDMIGTRLGNPEDVRKGQETWFFILHHQI